MSINDVNKLKEIAHKTPTAIRVMTFWAMKTRHAKLGLLDVAKERKRLLAMKESINDDHYLQLLSDLESAGYGKRQRDRKGRVIKFKFYHPISQLGKAAIEGYQPSPQPVPETAQIVRKRSVDATDFKTLVYVFVDGHRTKIEVDGQLSDKAISRLIDNFEIRGGNA